MATKDYYLPFKDNKHITSVDADNGQYNNLNLNSSQEQQPSIPLFKHQKIVLSGNKNVGNYGETNVTNSNDSYTTKGSSSSNYSKKDFRSIDLNNVSKKENGFSKNDSNNKNNSTLSLHIRAHEKAATVPVPFDSLKIKHKKSFFAIKWEKAKQIFTGCKPVIQNPFEFPRQKEENQQNKPYIIQFKASQQLLGSNRSLAKKGRTIAGNGRRSYISAAALSEAIKKVNNASFVRSVENGLNQKFDKLFFNEYDILEDLFIRYFASYIKQYRHPGYNVYFNAVQVNTNGNNSDNNAENSAENNEVIYQRLKVYKGRLSRMEILEILDLFRKGLLVQSAIFSQIFTKLCYKDTDIEAATMCVKCRKLFANSKSARTSHREHIKWHANNPEGDVIIPVTLKTLLIDCLADMISKDVFPFTVIEKPGFVNVLNTVFQRAFEYGLENGMNGNIPSVTPSIHDFLPCPNTLRNHVDSIVTTLTPEFSNYVKHHVETYGAAVSFDFTEKNSPYYVVTIHFLTKDWNLEHWSLEFGEYGGANSNSDTVLEQFLEVMGHHGITPEMVKRQIVICTDRGSNMLAAFVDFERIDDVCHQLSILSKRIPDPYKNNWLPQNFRLAREVVIALQGVSKLLKDVTKIIKGINSRLKLKKKLAESNIYLAKHNEIRWLSRFRSIKSFLKLFADDKTDIKEFVLDALYEHKIGTQYIYRDAISNVNDNLDTLTFYIDLIRPIKNAVKILESETVPTINQILLQYHEIEENFKECLTHESLIMQQMAASGIVALSYHKTITSSFSDYHTLALLLDPLKKDKIADIVGPENLAESIALFKRYLRKYEDNPVNDETDDAMADSPFAQFTTLNIDPLDVEAESYLKLKSQSVETQYHDVLDFWRAQEEKYPRVAKLARRILPIISSASSERQFSLLGRTLTPTRSSMSPQTVSNLINAKNLKRFKQEQEAKKAREG